MINQIQNIQLKRLNTLEPSKYDEYRSVLQYLKPKAVIRKRQAKDIMQLTFNEVELVKQSLRQPDIDGLATIFRIVYGLSRKELLKVRLIEFFHAYNHVIKQVNMIMEQENVKLRFEETDMIKRDQLQRAGVERLNIFGVLNTLDAIAQRYGTHPDIVKEWQYGYVFSLLFKMNVERQVQDAYAEIVKHSTK